MALLHPFMPFITEEIWQHLPHQGETIMLSPWPRGDAQYIDSEIEKQMAIAMDVIRAIRNIRSEMNVPLGKKAAAIISANSDDAYALLEKMREYICNLATVDELTLESHLAQKPSQAATAVVSGIEIYLPLKGLIDMDKEILRLEKEVEKTKQEIVRLESKLNNQGFVAKAPAAVVEKEKDKLAQYQTNAAALQKRLDSYKN